MLSGDNTGAADAANGSCLVELLAPDDAALCGVYAVVGLSASGAAAEGDDNAWVSVLALRPNCWPV